MRAYVHEAMYVLGLNIHVSHPYVCFYIIHLSLLCLVGNDMRSRIGKRSTYASREREKRVYCEVCVLQALGEGVTNKVRGGSMPCSRLIGLETELLHLDRRDPMADPFAILARPVSKAPGVRTKAVGKGTHASSLSLSRSLSRCKMYFIRIQGIKSASTERAPGSYVVRRL